MRKLISITLAIPIALLLLTTQTPVQADTWTGCVTPGGTLHRLAQGESPRTPGCQKKEGLIHLTDQPSKQSSQATYNHELMCMALAETAVSTGKLTALGCPKGTEPGPTGVALDVLNPNGTLECDLDPVSQAFYHLNIDGAMIGRQFQVANAEENNFRPDGECPTACNADDRCFMAWVDRASEDLKHQSSLTCHLFYRNDNAHWQFYGGFTESQCASTVRVPNAFWQRDES